MTGNNFLKENVHYQYLNKGKFGGVFGGDKIELLQDYRIQTNLSCTIGRRFKYYNGASGFVFLSSDGMLSIDNGWVWDGASGYTYDTPDTVEASLVHDALYFLHKKKKISRRKADKILYQILKKNDCPFFRRAAWFLAVRIFGWLY